MKKDRSDLGEKYDEGKLRYDLVPPEAMQEYVRVLTFGANKYADRNWEGGIAYSRLFAAAFRHMFAFLLGERMDPETGISHLAHAICCLNFLLTYEIRDMSEEFDDLPLR